MVQADKPQKILIIEDDPLILNVYRELFIRAGYETETALDSVTAVTRYESFRPDLIVMDVNLPAGDGRALFFRIRELFRSRTPVIFSTGWPDKVKEISSLHGVSVLIKPVELEVLLAEARRVLENTRPG